MQDFFGFVGDNPLTQIFTAHSTDWQVWEKPRGVTFVFIEILSGAGGGGGGFTRVAAANGGGGGGGACANSVRAMVPALFLPDRLFVQVGTGGAGGTANGAGSPGVLTTVSANRTRNQGMMVLDCGTTGGGGAAGAATGNAAGGVAGGAPNLVSQLGNWGLVVGTIGQAGATGGLFNAAGSNATPWTGTGLLCSGGAGGGGVTASNIPGGNVVPSDVTIVPQVTGGNAFVAGRGDDGYLYRGPMAGWLSLGGGGGASGNTVVGGNGGNGGPGSGGGGGGSGTTGGTGGKGGDGIVIIVCS